jgi:hypothetical protein
VVVVVSVVINFVNFWMVRKIDSSKTSVPYITTPHDCFQGRNFSKPSHWLCQGHDYQILFISFRKSLLITINLMSGRDRILYALFLKNVEQFPILVPCCSDVRLVGLAKDVAKLFLALYSQSQKATRGKRS